MIFCGKWLAAGNVAGSLNGLGSKSGARDASGTQKGSGGYALGFSKAAEAPFKIARVDAEEVNLDVESNKNDALEAF